jgi:S1-C subfamily serine protease
LRKGDIILEVNKRPVENASGFQKQLDAAKPGEILLLYVFRNGGYSLITLRIS